MLINAHNLAVEPELQALRYLRAVDKMSRYAKVRIDAKRDLTYLEGSLRTLIGRAPQVTDPSYRPRVQEQSASLLASGNPHLLKAAKRMGLDLRALAAGQLWRARRR